MVSFGDLVLFRKNLTSSILGPNLDTTPDHSELHPLISLLKLRVDFLSGFLLFNCRVSREAFQYFVVCPIFD